VFERWWKVTQEMILFSIFIIISILIVVIFLYVKISNYFHDKEMKKPRNLVLNELIKTEKDPVIRSRYVVEEKGYLRIIQELMFVIHHDRLNKVGNYLHEPIKEYSVNDFHFFTNIPSSHHQSIKLSFLRNSFPELDVDSLSYDKDSYEISTQYFSVHSFKYSDEFDKKMNQLLELIHPIWLNIRKEIHDDQKKIDMEKKKEFDKRYSGF